MSRTLDKLGMRSSDTAELSFVDVRVPVEHLIGEEGRGFQQQMEQFQQERMIAAYMAVGAMELALDRTWAYLGERQAFGAPLSANDHLRYELAEASAEVDLLKHYSTLVCGGLRRRSRTPARWSRSPSYKAGRLLRHVADLCLQFHGGLGYMEEHWTARFLRDQRLWSIGGGTDEIMLRTIAQLDSGMTKNS